MEEPAYPTTQSHIKPMWNFESASCVLLPFQGPCHAQNGMEWSGVQVSEPCSGIFPIFGLLIMGLHKS